MQFLTLSRRRTDLFPPEAFTAELAAHESQRVKELYAAGLLRQIWLRGDLPGASILWEAASEAEVRDALGQVPIFENILSAPQIETLASSCSVRLVAAGTAFIRQGEIGKSMFVLLDGAARVTIAMPDGETREVAVLASGDIVGEISLMTGAPRAASVISLTAMRLLEVTNESMELLLAAEPGLLERFSHVLAVRQLTLSEIASTIGQKNKLERDILAQIRKFFSRTFG